MPTSASKHYWTGCLAISGSKLCFNFDFDQTSCLSKCSQNIYTGESEDCRSLLWPIYLCLTASGESHEIISTIDLWQCDKGLCWSPCCPIQAAGFIHRIDIFTISGFTILRFYCVRLQVKNVVEVALSAHRPKFSPLQNSPQHMLLFD